MSAPTGSVRFASQDLAELRRLGVELRSELQVRIPPASTCPSLEANAAAALIGAGLPASVAWTGGGRAVRERVGQRFGSASVVQRSMHMVMAVTQHSRLCEEDLVLRRSLLVRNPKVDALNFLQVRTGSRSPLANLLLPLIAIIGTASGDYRYRLLQTSC